MLNDGSIALQQGVNLPVPFCCPAPAAEFLLCSEAPSARFVAAVIPTLNMLR